MESAIQEKPKIDVAAAIIRKGNLLLIAQREEDDTLGGLWEFPGGKKEDNESLEECLQREIKEELNVDIEVREFYTQAVGDFETVTIYINFFHCQYLGGEPKAIECADWRWVTVPELPKFPFASLDQDVIQKLSAEVK